MRDNPIDRMKDPFYTSLMWQIEQIICQTDQEAKNKGIRLTDSQIKSALNKTRRTMRGEEPCISRTNEKEEILSMLVDSLCLARNALLEQTQGADGNANDKPIDKADWVKAIETVEDSLNTRKSSVPGSRNYFDFVQSFIGDLKE